jgi:hypothetical protein
VPEDWSFEEQFILVGGDIVAYCCLNAQQEGSSRADEHSAWAARERDVLFDGATGSHRSASLSKSRRWETASCSTRFRRTRHRQQLDTAPRITTYEPWSS